jgi:hypothetical protein
VPSPHLSSESAFSKCRVCISQVSPHLPSAESECRVIPCMVCTQHQRLMQVSFENFALLVHLPWSFTHSSTSPYDCHFTTAIQEHVGNLRSGEGAGRREAEDTLQFMINTCQVRPHSQQRHVQGHQHATQVLSYRRLSYKYSAGKHFIPSDFPLRRTGMCRSPVTDAYTYSLFVSC